MAGAAPDDDGGGIDAWLAGEGIVGAPDAEGPGTIADIGLVRSHLVAAAREGRALSYAEMLGLLGHRFTRPRMRALCRTLDAIDAEQGSGEPALAVLVVRASDGLPGQGWWIGRTDAPTDWEGPAAHAYVGERQRSAFRYWRGR